MKNRLLYLILPIVALVLEISPYGAICNFANFEGEAFRRTYSYFSMVPFGYANFAPFLTGLITCVVVLLLLIYLFTAKSSIITATRIVLCVGVVISLCPLLFGISFFSIVGGLISLSLGIELFLLFAFTGKEH